MSWDDIRAHYPDQWLLVEAIEAITVDQMRHISDLSVIGTFTDFRAGWLAYESLHQAQPKRELYVVHTRRECLDIEVVQTMITKRTPARGVRFDSR